MTIPRLTTCRACDEWTGKKCRLYPRCSRGFRRFVGKPFSVCLKAMKDPPEKPLWTQDGERTDTK